MPLRDGDMELTFQSNFDAILETAKALFPDTRNVALVGSRQTSTASGFSAPGSTTIECASRSLERFRSVLGTRRRTRSRCSAAPGGRTFPASGR